MTVVQQGLFIGIMVFMLGMIPAIPRLVRVSFLIWGLCETLLALMEARLTGRGSAELIRFVTLVKFAGLLPWAVWVARELARRIMGVDAMEH